MAALVIFAAFFATIGTAGSSVTILDGQSCRAIDEEGGVLKVETLDSFIYSVDMNHSLEITAKFTEAYQRSKDGKGSQCSAKMSDRLEVSMNTFERQVIEYKEENMLLSYYLEAYAGRVKREIGFLVGLFFSIANMVATSLNIAVSEVRWNDLNQRFKAMSGVLEDLKTRQDAIVNNVNVISEENAFLGIETNFIADHVNMLQSVHSCDIINTVFETQMVALDAHLVDIMSSIFDKKLRHTLINRNLLEQITMNEFFDNTIYRIAPSLLYELARIDLLSFENGKVNFLVTFPVITRSYEYQRITLLEAPEKLVMTLPSYYGQKSFLIPYDMNVSNLTENLEEIRSARNCIKTEQFFACPSNDIEDSCLPSILMNNGSDCLENNVEKNAFAFQYNHRQKGALVNLHFGAKVIDTVTHQTLYNVSNENEIFCAFIPQQKNLVIVSNSKSVRLFPNVKIFSSVDNYVFKTIAIAPMKNLSLPRRNTNKTMIPIPIAPSVTVFKPNYAFIFGISISASIIAMIMIVIICWCIFKYLNEVDGNDLFIA